MHVPEFALVIVGFVGLQLMFGPNDYPQNVKERFAWVPRPFWLIRPTIYNFSPWRFGIGLALLLCAVAGGFLKLSGLLH